MDIKGSKPGSESQNMKKIMRGEFVMDPAPDPSQTEGFAVGSSQWLLRMLWLMTHQMHVLRWIQPHIHHK